MANEVIVRNGLIIEDGGGVSGQNNYWILKSYDFAGNPANLVKLSLDNIIEFGQIVGIDSLYHVLNSGFNDIVSIPVSSAAPDGTQEGVGISVGGNRILSVSALSDGAGSTDTPIVSMMANVGIGTTAPLSKLEIDGTANNAIPQDILTLGRPQTVGSYYAHSVSLALSSTAADLARLDFKLSSTNGSSIITPNATVMTLIANGNVGIATTSPSYPLHVVGECRNTSGVWVAISDARLKTNILDVSNPLDKVLRIAKTVKHYEFINKNIEGPRTGFIAQLLIEQGFEGHTNLNNPDSEADGLLLGWEYADEITTNEAGEEQTKRIVTKEGDKLLGIENNFAPYVFPAIAELNSIVQAQQALIEAQQSTISTLMTRMEALENKLNKQEETNI